MRATWSMVTALLGAGAALVLLSGCAGDTGEDVEAFLDRHWHQPLAPQGHPPVDYSPLEASLDIRSCAQCHAAQHQDWQTSRHSHTMGPGIRWQFDLFGQKDSNKCMECHAPLAEQKALVALEKGWGAAPRGAPPDHIPANLHDQGLACAACHVRGHERFGPPSRLGTAGTEAGLPHGGFRASEAFSDSRFCSTCHQFPDDGPRLAGKLRQDTYNEWRRSDHAAQGATCQSCHMPDRRHLWRGISDPETVRGGVTPALTVEPLSDGRLRIRAEVRNTGVGHLFPTYLVPRVDLRLVLVDAAGGEVRELTTHTIQWRASIDLQREEFDTRLPPGEAVTLEQVIEPPSGSGWHARLEMDVAPKEHYERMYRDMLRQAARMQPDTLALLRLALVEAEGSRYSLHILEQPLALPH